MLISKSLTQQEFTEYLVTKTKIKLLVTFKSPNPLTIPYCLSSFRQYSGLHWLVCTSQTHCLALPDKLSLFPLLLFSNCKELNLSPVVHGLFELEPGLELRSIYNQQSRNSQLLMFLFMGRKPRWTYSQYMLPNQRFHSPRT